MSADASYPDIPAEFVRHPPIDAEGLRAGIEYFGVRSILDAVVRAVEATDRDAASVALGLLRDGILVATYRELRLAYHKSDLLDLLRSKVYAPDYMLRGNAVYTLGKLGPRDNVRYLRAAFPWYMEHDPLGLDRLLFEIEWLARRGRVDRRQLMTEIVTSRSYLTRWVAVAMLWERELSRGRLEWGARHSPGWAMQLMRRLAQDPHHAVRADAQTTLAERRQRRLEGPRPRRSEPEAILDPRPAHVALDIESLEVQVNNYLYCSREADYDVELVEAVARHMDVHPIRPDHDSESYWAPLAEARRSSRHTQ